jgi:hypothetical protein
LPVCREGGITLIAQGLFAENDDIQRITTDIMKKLEKSKFGKKALQKLNYFFLLKYQQNV